MTQENLALDTNAALGMKIEQEFVVVSLTSGKFFHFTSESETFFSFFRKPKPLQAYFDLHGVSGEERHYLEAFCQYLLSERLLLTAQAAPGSPSEGTAPSEYVRPRLLREGGKTLAQFEFSYP